jgi:hypothetical protein
VRPRRRHGSNHSSVSFLQLNTGTSINNENPVAAFPSVPLHGKPGWTKPARNVRHTRASWVLVVSTCYFVSLAAGDSSPGAGCGVMDRFVVVRRGVETGSQTRFLMTLLQIDRLRQGHAGNEHIAFRDRDDDSLPCICTIFVHIHAT